jgi:hypothetical protein
MPGRLDIQFDWGRSPNGDPEADGTPFPILALAPWRGSASPPGLDERPVLRIDTESTTMCSRAASRRASSSRDTATAARSTRSRPAASTTSTDALLATCPRCDPWLRFSPSPGSATFGRGRRRPGHGADVARRGRHVDALRGFSDARRPRPSAALGAAESAVDRLVRDAVAPYVVAGPDPRQAEVVSARGPPSAPPFAWCCGSLRSRPRGPLALAASLWCSHRVRGARQHPRSRRGAGRVGRRSGRGRGKPSLAAPDDRGRAAAKAGSTGWSLIVLDATFEAGADDAAALRVGGEPSPRPWARRSWRTRVPAPRGRAPRPTLTIPLAGSGPKALLKRPGRRPPGSDLRRVGSAAPRVWRARRTAR